MKNNFKKVTAIVLSSLGILASAPSAFCVPKTCPNSAKKNHEITNAPKKRISRPKILKYVILNRIISKQNIDQKFTKKTLEIPNATFVDDYALANQPNIREIILPKAVSVGSRAFENCEKLERIVFTDQLTSIVCDAFVGCRKDLKIIFNEKEYSVEEFTKIVKPSVKVNIGPFQPLDFRYYGEDKINLQFQLLDGKVNDTTIEENSDCADDTTLTISEIKPQ